MSAATKTLIPRDTSALPVLSFDQYQRLKVDGTTRLGRLIEQTIPFALRTHRQYLGNEGMPLAEIVALASIVEPQLFERRTLAIDLEVEGRLTTGMTLFDRRPRSGARPNIDVLTTVDRQGVIDYFIRRIRDAHT